ncbi:MAG: hypothetical protein AABO41_22050 [Acidobacteriota bacterium]
MEIVDLLTNHLAVGRKFQAGIVNIDIIRSSQLAGSDSEKSKTRDALKELILSLLENYPIAVQSWSGDGGILLYDAASGFDTLIVICDKLINLLPLFNRARGRFNFLPNDEIHLRVVCHAGDVQNNGKPDTLASDALNDVAKREREVGVEDHVVASHEIYRRLAPDLQERFSPTETTHPQLGACYVLDQRLSAITLQLDEHKSDEIRDWIIRSTKEGHYDQLDIFSYSNETLYRVVGLLHNVRTRVLARNWMIEAEEENAFNEDLAKSDISGLRRPWVKSDAIRRMAQFLIDFGAQFLFKNGVELRFYDTRPLLKGAMLRDSKTGMRTAHIGFYSWNPERVEGGSPYVGDRWTAMSLSNDEGAQTIMLNAIQSLFDELWSKGQEYNLLIELEKQQNLELLQVHGVEKIWEIDRRQPYLIVVPGRIIDGRPYPSVTTEDLGALREVEALLKESGAKVEIEIMQDPNTSSERIKQWPGHLVHICHRTLNKEVHDYLQQQNFPYQLITESEQNPRIIHTRHDVPFVTPADRGESERRDYCVVGKCDRPNGIGKLFIIAGLHAMGTWGGGFYLSRPEHLQKLCANVERNNFAVVIECEYDVPPRVTNARNVMEPETFEADM